MVDESQKYECHSLFIVRKDGVFRFWKWCHQVELTLQEKTEKILEVSNGQFLVQRNRRSQETTLRHESAGLGYEWNWRSAISVVIWVDQESSSWSDHSSSILIEGR